MSLEVKVQALPGELHGSFDIYDGKTGQLKGRGEFRASMSIEQARQILEPPEEKTP